jgi:uncharacterized membrane protein required for colicin V production
MDQFQSLLTYLQDPDTPYGIMDPVYTLYMIYGLILGLFRGLPEELAHLVGTLLIAVGAYLFYQPVSAVMLEHTRLDSEEASLALAYLLMILFFFVAWRIIILVLKKALDWTCPKPLYRPGGAILGMGKCVLVLCVILFMAQLSGHRVLTDHLISRSWLGNTLVEFIPERAHEVLPEWIPGAAGPGEPEPTPPQAADGSGDA